MKLPSMTRDQQFHDYGWRNTLLQIIDWLSIRRINQFPIYIVAKGELRLKNSPRASIKFVNKIDRASLASVMLEGFLPRLFQGIEWRSIGRKSEAAEPFKGSIGAKLTTRRKRNRSLIEPSLRMVFTRKSHPKLLFTTEKLRYHWISNPTASPE